MADTDRRWLQGELDKLRQEIRAHWGPLGTLQLLMERLILLKGMEIIMG